MLKKGQPTPDEPSPPVVEPHPAEDLSADDDLLSWILVDQLGALPNTRLGVHPQQVKFVGPMFKTEEVMDIVKETVVKGHINEAMQRLQEFHLIQAHLQSKMTEGQRERFIQHLRRYLLPLMPSSRVEVFTTPRYTAVTKHTELAVFATRPLAPGTVLQELQGSVVPLPDAWREEMEIGEDFAYRAAEEDEDFSDSEAGSDDEDGDESGPPKEKHKGKERDSESRSRGARRSDRTKRRDFSIVWSGLKRCFQLFLGPARFLNHDCQPNVELLRQGKYVTFRVTQHIRVGEEITASYGENYFGRNNIECLCATCEENNRGGFTPKPESSRRTSRSRSHSRDMSAAPSAAGPSSRPIRPSALRNMLAEVNDDMVSTTEDGGSTTLRDSPGPSRRGSNDDAEMEDGGSVVATPRKGKGKQSARDGSERADEESGTDSENEVESPVRERSRRLAAKKIKPWAFLRKPREIEKAMRQGMGGTLEEEEDLPEDFPRCGTCAKPLHERVWYANRYFDHCPRCIRHALIFSLPWPAHKLADVMEYPPSHMIPVGYVPKRVSTIPLPTLSKKKPEPIPEPPQTLPALSKVQKAQWEFRRAIEVSEYLIELLRNEAWSQQEAEEQAVWARVEQAEQAKKRRDEARAKKMEEKRKRDANKIKGSGVWSKYEYVTAEELERRIQEKNMVTSGTRRGGRFRGAEEEEAMKALAEEKRQREEAKRRKREARAEERLRLLRAGHAVERDEEEGEVIMARAESDNDANVDDEEEEKVEDDYTAPSPLPAAGPSKYKPSGTLKDKSGDAAAGEGDEDSSSSEVRRMVEPPGSSSSSRSVGSPALRLEPPSERAAGRGRGRERGRSYGRGRGRGRGDSSVTAGRELLDEVPGSTPVRSNGFAATANAPDTVDANTTASSTPIEAPAKRPRGRPRGSGKHQRRLASQVLGSTSSPAGSSGVEISTPPASASRTRASARNIASPMRPLKLEDRSGSIPTSPRKTTDKSTSWQEVIEIESDSDLGPDIDRMHPSPRETPGDDAYYEMLDAMPSPRSASASVSKLLLASNKTKQSPRRRPRSFYPTSSVKLAPAVGSSSTATGYVMVTADGTAIRKGKGKGSVDEVSDQTKEVNGTGSASAIGSGSSHTHSSPLGPGAGGVVGEKGDVRLVERVDSEHGQGVVDDEEKAGYAAARQEKRKRKRMSEDAEVVRTAKKQDLGQHRLSLPASVVSSGSAHRPARSYVA